MSVVPQQFKCDECGRMKVEANHWFLCDGRAECFVLMPWDTNYVLCYGHVCGSECALKRLNKWMTGRASA